MLRWVKRRLMKTDPPAVAAVYAPAPSDATASASMAAPAPEALDIPRDKIASRAAEIWERKGRPHGQDVQNWMEAEAELRAEFAANSDPEPLPRKSR